MPMETTRADRERELAALLERFRQHPERAWQEERRRAAVLRHVLAEPAA